MSQKQLISRTCRRQKRAVFFELLIVLLFCGIQGSSADERNPLAGSAKAAKAGEYEFRINCALCHGLGARGGGRGPDLTRALKKHTHNDAEMFQVISNGIPGTAMPANGTNGQGVGMTDEEIWQRVLARAHSRPHIRGFFPRLECHRRRTSTSCSRTE